MKKSLFGLISEEGFFCIRKLCLVRLFLFFLLFTEQLFILQFLIY